MVPCGGALWCNLLYECYSAFIGSSQTRQRQCSLPWLLADHCVAGTVRKDQSDLATSNAQLEQQLSSIEQRHAQELQHQYHTLQSTHAEALHGINSAVSEAASAMGHQATARELELMERVRRLEQTLLHKANALVESQSPCKSPVRSPSRRDLRSSHAAGSNRSPAEPPNSVVDEVHARLDVLECTANADGGLENSVTCFVGDMSVSQIATEASLQVQLSRAYKEAEEARRELDSFKQSAEVSELCRVAQEKALRHAAETEAEARVAELESKMMRMEQQLSTSSHNASMAEKRQSQAVEKLASRESLLADAGRRAAELENEMAKSAANSAGEVSRLKKQLSELHMSKVDADVNLGELESRLRLSGYEQQQSRALMDLGCVDHGLQAQLLDLKSELSQAKGLVVKQSTKLEAAELELCTLRKEKSEQQTQQQAHQQQVQHQQQAQQQTQQQQAQQLEFKIPMEITLVPKRGLSCSPRATHSPRVAENPSALVERQVAAKTAETHALTTQMLDALEGELYEARKCVNLQNDRLRIADHQIAALSQQAVEHREQCLQAQNQVCSLEQQRIKLLADVEEQHAHRTQEVIMLRKQLTEEQHVKNAAKLQLQQLNSAHTQVVAEVGRLTLMATSTARSEQNEAMAQMHIRELERALAEAQKCLTETSANLADKSVELTLVRQEAAERGMLRQEEISRRQRGVELSESLVYSTSRSRSPEHCELERQQENNHLRGVLRAVSELCDLLCSLVFSCVFL